MKLTIGYCRVSTDKQDTSLEVQEAKIRAMATLKDLAVVMIADSESAKSLDRPGMARLLAMVDAGEVETVIIAKLDRLTRSVKDLAVLLERFQRRGVSLVSVAESLDTGSAAGRLVLNIMTSVAQWEREAIGERTRAVLQHKKATGKAYTRSVFGFDAVDGRSVPNPAEQAVIAKMWELRGQGLSYHGVADRLNAEGIATKRGGVWASQTVCNILESVKAA
ncbi:MAG: recombinase family protein [Candidatus Sulfopaludibacter sp.]|nr:recombinase family protein [Candidatus Sulfopaludibacter sp.]